MEMPAAFLEDTELTDGADEDGEEK